jgi:asparagine synthetase B (glutamine-hydrolysing)
VTTSPSTFRCVLGPRAGAYSGSLEPTVIEEQLAIYGAEVGRSPRGTRCAIAGTATVSTGIGASARLASDHEAATPQHIASLWDELGEMTLDRLRGSFIVLVVDADGTAWLSADALGSRGLHYTTHAGALIAAEDAAEVVRALPSSPGPNSRTVGAWLSSGLTPPGLTHLSGISRLNLGEALMWREGQPSRTIRWFELSHDRGAIITDPMVAQAATRDAMRTAVARAGAGCRDVGVLLSGGVDSSAVAACAAELWGGGSVSAVSARFPSLAAADEGELIEATVSALGLRSHTVDVPVASPLESWAEHARRWRLPSPSPVGAITDALIGEADKSGVPVVLTGQGGDEVLYNLPQPYLLDLLRFGRVFAAWNLAAQSPRIAPGRRNQLRALRGTIGMLSRELDGGPTDAMGLLQPGLRAQALDDRRATWWWKGRGPLWFRHRSYTLSRLRDLVDASGVLRRLTPPGSTTQRHPLLHDRDLVECFARFHPRMFFEPGFDRIIARRAFANVLPEQVAWRRYKSHFTDLHTEWMLGDGLRQIPEVLSPNALVWEFADRRVAETRVLATGSAGRHPGGTYGWSSEAHRLLALELWLREL